MSPQEAAQAVKRGATIKMTVGTDDDDPVLLVWAEDDLVQSYAIEGWSAGAQEAVCDIGSNFLADSYFAGKHELEVTLLRPPSGWLRGESIEEYHGDLGHEYP